MLTNRLAHRVERNHNMRKLIEDEFMTLDGVIQNEENDGDGFKYGGWFFPYADEVTGAPQIEED